MNSLGERIKDLRRDAKLTQRELAQILSITVPTLSHWECNYQEPSYKDILRICNYFSISADYLLGRTDELGAMITSPAQSLSDRETRVLSLFRKMSTAQQNRYIGFGEGLIGDEANTKNRL